MSKKRKKRKIRKKNIQWIITSLVGAVLVGIAAFSVAFHTDYIDVTGNNFYTDKEIEEIALDTPFASNTILLKLFHKEIKVDDYPMLKSVEIKKTARNRISIQVEEKQLIGYVVENNEKLYFDKDGVILESIPIQVKKEGEEQEPDTAEPVSPESGAQESITPEPIPEEETGAEEEKDNEVNNTEKEENAILERVPRINGLEYETAKLNQKLDVKDEKVFNTILGISRMVDKFDIIPDYITMMEDGTITLSYSGVHVQIGADEYLEEKMARAAAILPKLEGKRGILHLEDYTESTKNIIFEESTESSKKGMVSLVGADGEYSVRNIISDSESQKETSQVQNEQENQGEEENKPKEENEPEEENKPEIENVPEEENKPEDQNQGTTSGVTNLTGM